MAQLGLLRSRRLWPLTVAQACAALNDNLVKNALLVLALFRLHLGGVGLSALAGALFIVPYVLLSATAGALADRYPKPRSTFTDRFPPPPTGMARRGHLSPDFWE